MGLIKPAKVPQYFSTTKTYILELGKHLLDEAGNKIDTDGSLTITSPRWISIFLEPEELDAWESAGKLDGLETYDVINFRLRPNDDLPMGTQNYRVEMPIHLYHEATDYTCPDGVVRHKIGTFVPIPNNANETVTITGAELMVMVPRKYR